MVENKGVAEAAALVGALMVTLEEEAEEHGDEELEAEERSSRRRRISCNREPPLHHSTSRPSWRKCASNNQ